MRNATFISKTSSLLRKTANKIPVFSSFLKRSILYGKWSLEGKLESKAYKLAFLKEHPTVPYNMIDEYLFVENSGLFDVGWYLSTYNDIKTAGTDPILHYIFQGYRESRDPSLVFSTARYINHYEDIKSAGINPLLHFLYHGKKEGRVIFPSRLTDSGWSVNDTEIIDLDAPSIQKIVHEEDVQVIRTPLSSRVKPYKREITTIRKVAFIAQPEYFDFHYREELEDLYEVKYFPNSFSGDPSHFDGVVAFDADINIFFRGELVPAETLHSLSGIKVNLSSEPFPKLINRSFQYTHDSLERFQFFLRIFDLPYDYIFHYDEISKGFFENQGIMLSGFFPFPLITGKIRPIPAPKKWDIFFSGRSTPHRDTFFGPLKRDFHFLHINHGVVGEDLLEYISKCKIAINVHAENELSWEPRTQLLLASGALLISEPLSHTSPLRPGIDFLEAKDSWDMYTICKRVVANYDEYVHIAASGRKRVEEELDSRKNFPKFFNEILEGRYRKAVFNPNKLNLRVLEINAHYNGFEHLLTELLHEHA
jgi:hypothetical protein